MDAVPPLSVTGVAAVPSPKSKVTVPFGVPFDAVPVMVAVKVTDCPAMLGLPLLWISVRLALAGPGVQVTVIQFEPPPEPLL